MPGTVLDRYSTAAADVIVRCTDMHKACGLFCTGKRFVIEIRDRQTNVLLMNDMLESHNPGVAMAAVRAMRGLKSNPVVWTLLGVSVSAKYDKQRPVVEVATDILDRAGITLEAVPNPLAAVEEGYPAYLVYLAPSSQWRHILSVAVGRDDESVEAVEVALGNLFLALEATLELKRRWPAGYLRGRSAVQNRD